MQKQETFFINQLKDTSKNIKIINFFNNSVVYFGNFEGVPTFWKSHPMRLFTPYKNYYEFTI